MTTRRNVSDQLDAAARGEKHDFKPKAGEKSDIAPAVPAHVIFKLLGFTLAMVVGPIATYFLTVDLVFGGNSTYAGGLAALMANVVLVGYVIVAMMEDQSEAIENAEKDKKSL
ncbi:Vacuolar ATPase assembly integral membrane vma21 [Hyphodiscus hymeniophilus]|uniref:Vacuolar ATPase assembly integral membrane vma21 n=1 Tax=Hyphodiscus hymeniophilus TaxID=353542 RepID=A0A9P6VMT9_9HELO|nr:Vacuolar ATPase assembly integral membrane vma21 [Hyphodiscus hymeniophilus]